MAYAEKAKKTLKGLFELLANRPPAQCSSPRHLGIATYEGRRYVGEVVALRSKIENLVDRVNAPGTTLEERLCNAGLSPDDLAWTQAIRRYCNQVVHGLNASQNAWDGCGNFEWCKTATAYAELLPFSKQAAAFTRPTSPRIQSHRQVDIEYALREANMKRRYENMCKEIDVEYLESWAEAPHDDSLDGRWVTAMDHVRAFCKVTFSDEGRVLSLLSQGTTKIEVIGTSFGTDYAGHAKGILDYDSMLMAFRRARE